MLLAICFIVWLYAYSVCKRGKLGFYAFLIGSVGMFLFALQLLPYIQEQLISLSVYLLSFFGDMTGMYDAYAKYGAFVIQNEKTLVTLYVDLECSGIIEMFVFVCLLTFFPVYNWKEKIGVGFVGVFLIGLFNHIRMLLILLLLYHGGMGYYFLAHTVLGRVIFYGLTIVLYYFVFTKKQIQRQKVGGFDFVSSTVE